MTQTTGKPKPLPIALLVIAILVLLAYKALWPWAPYWVDILVGVVALVLWLSQKRSSQKVFETNDQN